MSSEGTRCGVSLNFLFLVITTGACEEKIPRIPWQDIVPTVVPKQEGSVERGERMYEGNLLESSSWNRNRDCDGVDRDRDAFLFSKIACQGFFQLPSLS